MLCKSCGMDSTTTDICSFCGQPLRTPSVRNQPIETGRTVESNESVEKSDAVPGSASIDVPETDGTEILPLSGSVAPTISAPVGPITLSETPTAASDSTVPLASPKAHFSPGATAVRRPAPPAPAGKGSGRLPAPPAPPSRKPAALDFLNTRKNAPVIPEVDTTQTTVLGLNAPRPEIANAAPMAETSAAVTSSVADLTSDTPLVYENPATPASAITAGLSASTTTGSSSAVADAKSLAAKPRTTGQETGKKDAGKGEVILVQEGLSPLLLLGRYLAAFTVILMVGGALAYLGKQYYVVPLLLVQFFGGLLLPVMRVVAWAEEDSDDVGWFLGLTLMFGPMIALAAYAIVGVMRQSLNPAVLLCLVIALLTRVIVESAAGHFNISELSTLGLINTGLGMNLFKLLLLNWSGFLALAGWYSASVFHKLDE